MAQGKGIVYFSSDRIHSVETWLFFFSEWKLWTEESLAKIEKFFVSRILQSRVNDPLSS